MRVMLPRSDDANARYANPDSDPRGPWKPSDLTARNFYSKGTYEVTGPTGKRFKAGIGRYWLQAHEAFLELDRDGRIWWGSSGDAMPQQKRFLSDVQKGMVPQTIWPYQEVGHTQEAKKDLLKYVPFVNTENVLNSVKPTRLLRRILQLATSTHETDIVLDFFSGSAPMGQAVIEQNQDDGGDRRFILVQIPERLPTPEVDMTTIFDMGGQRLRGLAKKNPELRGDFGFRVFKLDSSNIREWDPHPEDLGGTLDAAVEHLKLDRTEQDILYELLLKRGIELTVSIQTREIVGKQVHSIGAGTLFVCLAERIERADAESLALGIVEWRDALQPADDVRVLFRDSGFADDVAKTNLAEILRQHGLKDVKSI